MPGGGVRGQVLDRDDELQGTGGRAVGGQHGVMDKVTVAIFGFESISR